MIIKLSQDFYENIIDAVQAGNFINLPLHYNCILLIYLNLVLQNTRFFLF